MTTQEKFYKSIDNLLIQCFFTLGKIIKSKDSSNADKIQAINTLFTLRTKMNIVSSEEDK